MRGTVVGRSPIIEVSLATELDLLTVKDCVFADVQWNTQVKRCLRQGIYQRGSTVFPGDFNARVEKDFQLWKGTIIREEEWNPNSNGTLLLTKCVEHKLVITKTLFYQKDKFKTSQRHPWPKHWHNIVYVIVQSQTRKSAARYILNAIIINSNMIL